MITINANLFGHIENDASLTGTYGLEGTSFTHTVQYLKQYLDKLTKEGKAFPAAYSSLLEKTKYLMQVQQYLDEIEIGARAFADVNNLVHSIITKMKQLAVDEQLLLPGGWYSTSDGHTMIYEIQRTKDGFLFKAYNSGDGIRYHFKKSSRHKELYNPIKAWHIPLPQTPKDANELELFFTRLLKANLPPPKGTQKKPIDARVLYEELLASISYIGGKETEEGTKIVPHGYTGGQLSGTCAQRSIHQMLKLCTEKEEEYQRFIFDFKQHALFDYVNACMTGQQPFNHAVAHQIILSINNNLKILKSLKLNQKEHDAEIKKLIRLKKSIIQAMPQKAQTNKIVAQKPPIKLTIAAQPAAAPLASNVTYSSTPSISRDVAINRINQTNLLHNLDTAISNIKKIQDLAAKWHYIEQLLLDLPCTNANDSALTLPFYAELKTKEDYEIFLRRLESIQDEIDLIRKEWLKDALIPTVEVGTLCLLNLRMDTQNKIDQLNYLPSFAQFTKNIMSSIIDNTQRNPFWATNNPILDHKFNELYTRYKANERVSLKDYLRYLNDIINKEPELNEQLKLYYYQKKYADETTAQHNEIRKEGLESLFMLSMHLRGHENLPTEFVPLVKRLENYRIYDAKLRKTINPYYDIKYSPFLPSVDIMHDELTVRTPLFPAYLASEPLTTKLSLYKYNLEDSPAKKVLEADQAPKSAVRMGIIKAKSANMIQLEPIRSTDDSAKQITQSDIIARDYAYLRSVPSFQVALTLDYFTRNINKLEAETDQRYVEANIFQPGLLLKACLSPDFFTGFDSFINTGLRYFTKGGQHTKNSLFYIRLNYLVSHYLSQNNDQRGLMRLKEQQEELMQQITLPNTPEVAYALNQYLFLNLMAQIEQGEDQTHLFEPALRAYFYIKGHTNHHILEDATHRFEVDKTIAQFQFLMKTIPESKIQKTIKETLAHSEQPIPDYSTIRGTFPSYNLINAAGKITCSFNAQSGMLFEKNLARSGVPLAIQNHPLIRHLNLQNINECLSSADGTFMILSQQEQEVHLHYRRDNLTIHQEWQIDGQKSYYELQALTADHPAALAHKGIKPINADLPKNLIDGSINYWKHLSRPNTGILVKDNVPIYSIENGIISALDTDGKRNGSQLIPAPKSSAPLNAFESSEFIVTETNGMTTQIKLPRYNLTFEDRPHSPTLINQQTGEQVINSPSPVHPAVAGLILQSSAQHQRYIVPVKRFYATEVNARESEMYPINHDIEDTIAHTEMEQHWKDQPSLNKPMWHYNNSEQYISFQLKNGEPVADKVTDALYLAYIYLATDQPEKAWATLEDCHTRLGGLTGDPAELTFIFWICKELPHILQAEKEQHKSATRKGPPYVACQLKTLSLLTDYLLQDGTFALKEPSTIHKTNNEHYALQQHNKLNQFLNALPTTIYKTYDRLQRMRRHLEHSYTLSNQERKQLLDYYHQQFPKHRAPLGALGYEWMSLSIETILQEKEGLLARRIALGTLSVANEKRLAQIEKHLAALKPIVSKSTILEKININLSLPKDFKINESQLSPEAKMAQKNWYDDLSIPSPSQNELNNAINLLSSDMSDSTFIENFCIYLSLAMKSNDHSNLKKELVAFCVKTLIAKRHIPYNKQDSNIPALCNILYHVAENSNNAAQYARHLSSAKERFSFEQLLKLVASYHVPPLSVFQAKDVYAEILAVPEEIIQKERPQSRVLINPDLKRTSLINEIEIQKHIAPQQQQSLNDFLHQCQTIQRNSAERLDVLGKELERNPDRAFAIETEAGTIRLDLEKQQNQLAHAFLNNPILIDALTTAIDQTEAQQHAKTQNAWTAALTLANQGPDDPEQAKAWLIEKKSQARPTLTQAHLLALYSRADAAYSVELTGLNPRNAQKLHDLIHNALIQGIQNKLIKRIKFALEKAKNSNNANSVAEALELLSRNEIPGLNDPSIVIIQHEEDIILTLRQVNSLKSLLETSENGKPFNEVVEKIIMGGGKSKVILPILAERKAQGNNLVIVEVPQSLLATNYVDLNRTSQRLFAKRAYQFEFNRDSNCSPQRLEQIYHLFTKIMTSREYLITTGEAMQSLELKYIELLCNKENNDQTWEKQVFWLDKITNLIRHNGDAIIDEVHQGLWVKKKLNYTSGDPAPINPKKIQYALDIYSFIDIEFIKKAPTVNVDYDWTPFKKDLATKLIKQPNSPLAQFVKRTTGFYGADIQDELIAYLTNTTSSKPEAIRTAPEEIQAMFSFFKGEINKFLPETLKAKLRAKYGPSGNKTLSAIAKSLAIPYSAKDMPNERNRHGQNIEAMNYSIQMMLLDGVSKELLSEQIVEWQTMARQEHFKDSAIKNPDESPTAQGFALLIQNPELPLSKIDVTNKEQLTTLHTVLRYNQTLMKRILKEQTLKLIQEDSEIIHSDSFNHVDLYRTTQGISGTPNPTTYHERLKYNKTSSLGTDGYLYQLLLAKNTGTIGSDFQNMAQYLEETLTLSKDRADCRAIIEISPTFTGINNLTAAKELSVYIKKHQDYFSNKIKHVLYFNENNVLCALDIENPVSPIILGTSDTAVINRLLGTTPEERFTYYDQARITGTDIIQAANSHALVLVDDKLSAQTFYQGCMRMRGLSKNQTITLVVPSRLKGTNCQQLMDRYINNDKKNSSIDTFFAAKGQLINKIRRDLLTRVQNLPADDVKAKAELMQHIKQFVADSPEKDLVKLFGAIEKKQATNIILQKNSQRLIKRWSACLDMAGMKPTEKEKTQLALDLNQIIESSLPHCDAEYETHDATNSIEVEIQKEIEKQIEIELLALEEYFDPKSSPLETRFWWPYQVPRIDDAFTHPKNTPNSLTLNSLCNTTIFSDEVLASTNYAETYYGQKDKLGAFLKPVFLIWYHLLENGELYAMIVTPQEVESLKLRFIPGSDWISTTQDRLIEGRRPDSILANEQYQSLKEQVRFLNGEFNGILNQETSPIWLQERSEEKLAFFEEKLHQIRPNSSQGLQQMKVALTQNNAEGFEYISKHPFTDLSDFDWGMLYPNASDAQIAEYQKLANTFAYLNKNWMNKNVHLSIDGLQQQFNLQLSSLQYLNGHLNHLSTLKKLLTNGRDTAIRGLFNIVAMEEKEGKLFLQACIGMSFNELKTLHDRRYKDMCVHSLILLGSYPAIYDRTIIDEALIYFVKNNSLSTITLILLATMSTPPEGLLAHVLKDKNCDLQIISAILDRQDVFTEATLDALVTACTTEETLNKLIARADLTESVIQRLLKEKNLNETHIEKILASTKQESVIEFIFTLKVNEKIQNELYNHPLFTSTVMISLIEKNQLTDDELMKIINMPSDPKARVLKTIAAKPGMPEELIMALISCPEADAELFISLLNHNQFSLDLAKQMMKQKIINTDAGLLYQFAAMSLNEYAKAAQPEEKTSWLKIINKLFKQAAKNDELSNILIELITLKHLEGTPLDQATGRIALLHFGSKVLDFIPINDIVNDADATLLGMLLNFEYLPKWILATIIQKCGTDELMNQVLARKDISNSLVLKILENPICSDEHLKRALPFISKDTVLERVAPKELMHLIYKHPALSTRLVEGFIAQNILDEEEALLIIQHETAITTKVLDHFAHSSVLSDTLISSIITHKKVSTEIINYLINNEMFSIDNAEKILKLPHNFVMKNVLPNLIIKTLTQCEKKPAPADWEKFFTQLLQFTKDYNMQHYIFEALKKHHIHSIKSAFEMIRYLGSSVIDYIPIETIIINGTQEAFELIIEYTADLNEQQLIILAQKIENPEQIHKMLAHTTLPEKVINALINNPHFDGKINNWPWLNEQHILSLIEKTKEYNSLKTALEHPCLTKKGRNNWLHQMIQQHELATKNSNNVFLNCLDAFRIKAYSNAVKAVNNEKYQQVAETGFTLYCNLRTATDIAFKKPSPNIAQLKIYCKEEIDKSKDILNTHRGYKQLFLNFLKALTLGLLNNWRFFKANTDTMIKASNIVQNAEEHITPKKNA